MSSKHLLYTTLLFACAIPGASEPPEFDPTDPHAPVKQWQPPDNPFETSAFAGAPPAPTQEHHEHHHHRSSDDSASAPPQAPVQPVEPADKDAAGGDS